MQSACVQSGRRLCLSAHDDGRTHVDRRLGSAWPLRKTYIKNVVMFVRTLGGWVYGVCVFVCLVCKGKACCKCVHEWASDRDALSEARRFGWMHWALGGGEGLSKSICCWLQFVHTAACYQSNKSCLDTPLANHSHTHYLTRIFCCFMCKLILLTKNRKWCEALRISGNYKIEIHFIFRLVTIHK